MANSGVGTDGFAKRSTSVVKYPSLGVVRLDSDYTENYGDICSHASYNYRVYYKVVPGLTFEMCQAGKLSQEVEQRFKQSIRWLVEVKNVDAITSSCGFMMYFQDIAREVSTVPVFLSSLCLLPVITCALAENEQVIIMTANARSLGGMKDLIRSLCGVKTQGERFNIVGCEDVDGFEKVAIREKVDVQQVQPGIVKRALQALEKFPRSKAFLLECTCLPHYANAIRYESGLPVFDAISACDFFVDSRRQNIRYGLQGWQHQWDGTQEPYEYGDNLTKHEKEILVNNSKNSRSNCKSRLLYPWDDYKSLSVNSELRP